MNTNRWAGRLLMGLLVMGMVTACNSGGNDTPTDTGKDVGGQDIGTQDVGTDTGGGDVGAPVDLSPRANDFAPTTGCNPNGTWLVMAFADDTNGTGTCAKVLNGMLGNTITQAVVSVDGSNNVTFNDGTSAATGTLDPATCTATFTRTYTATDSREPSVIDGGTEMLTWQGAWTLQFGDLGAGGTVAYHITTAPPLANYPCDVTLQIRGQRFDAANGCNPTGYWDVTETYSNGSGTGACVANYSSGSRSPMEYGVLIWINGKGDVLTYQEKWNDSNGIDPMTSMTDNVNAATCTYILNFPLASFPQAGGSTLIQGEAKGMSFQTSVAAGIASYVVDIDPAADNFPCHATMNVSATRF